MTPKQFKRELKNKLENPNFYERQIQQELRRSRKNFIQGLILLILISALFMLMS